MPCGFQDVPSPLPGSTAAANATRTKEFAERPAEESEQFVLAQATGFRGQTGQQSLKGRACQVWKFVNSSRGTHRGYASSDKFLMARTFTHYEINCNQVNITSGFYVELVTLAAIAIAN
jgi:hypothetical protein